MSETVLNDTTEYTRYIIDDKVVTIIGRIQDEKSDCGAGGVGVGVAEYVTSSVNNDKNSVVLLEYKDPKANLHGIDDTLLDIYQDIRNKRQIVPFDYRIYFLGQKNEYKLYKGTSSYQLSKEDIVKMFINPFFDKYKEAFKMREDLYPKFFLGWLEYFVGIMTKKLTDIKRGADTVSNVVIINEVRRFWDAIPTFYVLREIFRKTSSKNIFVMAEGHYSKITSMLEMIYLENKELKIHKIDPVRTGDCISIPGPKTIGTHDLYRGLPDALRLYMVDEYVDLPGLEAQLAMVKKDPEKIADILDPHPDVSMDAVKKDGHVLRYVRPDLQTPELTMAAVKENGHALQFVRPDLQTHEIAMVAVKQDGRTLKYVRPDLQTHELAMTAVNKPGQALQYVRDDLQTPRVVLAAVNNNGLTLKYAKRQTPRIALAAVKNYGQSLQYVKKDLLTPEIVKAAIDEDGKALRYVPRELQTPEMVLDAVKQDGRAMGYVRKDLKTPELSAIAMVYQYPSSDEDRY